MSTASWLLLSVSVYHILYLLELRRIWEGWLLRPFIFPVTKNGEHITIDVSLFLFLGCEERVRITIEGAVEPSKHGGHNRDMHWHKVRQCKR